MIVYVCFEEGNFDGRMLCTIGVAASVKGAIKCINDMIAQRNEENAENEDEDMPEYEDVDTLGLGAKHATEDGQYDYWYEMYTLED